MRGPNCAILLLPGLLVGCGNAVGRIVPDPSSITLSQALVQTVDALYDARAAALRHRRTDIPLGLNTCTVQATFNVTAGGTDDNKLVITLGTPTAAPINASLAGSAQDTATAGRSNQIVVLFTSPACNPTGTLGSTKPDQVNTLEMQIEAARDGGMVPVATRRKRSGSFLHRKSGPFLNQ